MCSGLGPAPVRGRKLPNVPTGVRKPPGGLPGGLQANRAGATGVKAGRGVGGGGGGVRRGRVASNESDNVRINTYYIT